MSVYKVKAPEYEPIKAGDIIAIGSDQWYVKSLNYLPAGFSSYEGALREFDTDNLALSLLRVNEVPE